MILDSYRKQTPRISAEIYTHDLTQYSYQRMAFTILPTIEYVRLLQLD